jgi:probable F420-dependent oxidoreductase
MQFATNLPIGAGDPLAFIDTAQFAEELGYEEVWLGDHIVRPLEVSSKYPYTAEGGFGVGGGAFNDVFVTLGAVAVKTERIRLGTSVLIVPYRNPVITAKMLATVDVLSKGRLDIGIGAGWLAEEFEALDMPFAERGRRTDEFMDLWKKLWSENPVSFEGKYYHLKPVSFDPKPVQQPHPPIWVGGNSPAALRRLVDHGDAWQPINVSAAQMPEYIERIRTLCRERGRNFDELKLSVNRGLLLFDDADQIRRPDPSWPYHPIFATPDELIAELRQYRDLGIHQVHFHFAGRTDEARRALMTRVAHEIRPAVEA